MTTKDELTKLTDNIRYLDRDVRLACMQGIVNTQIIIDLDDEVSHRATIAEQIAIAADILGFFDEAKEKGLTPQETK